MGDKTPDDGAPARYTARPLPDYRHVPGRTPHPTRDPRGHSYGQAKPVVPDLNTADWRDCDEFLYGLDLFNAGYWWECHEVLENLWHAAGLGTPAGYALQAVIQCAAAHLKVECGQALGAKRLADHAAANVAWCGAHVLGLELRDMIIDTWARIDGAPAAARLRLSAPPHRKGDTGEVL